MNKHNQSNDMLLIIAIAILSFIFFNVAITSTLFLIGIKITLFNIIFATIASFLLSYYFGQRLGFSCKKSLVTIAIAVIIIIINFAIHTQIPDFTWDGNWYHKAAVGMMKDGWNPTRQTAREFYNSSEISIRPENHNSTHIPRQLHLVKNVYETYYPKAPWMFAANVYKLTKKIESGHAINSLSSIMLFCLICSFLLRTHKKIFAILISLLFAISPILIPQTFTFYNDGLQGTFVLAMMTSLALIAFSKDQRYSIIKYSLFFMIASFLINIKFTGLVFTGFYALTFFTYMLITYKKTKQPVMPFFITGVITVFFAIGIVGFSPYIKNVFDVGHPFYPVAGRNKIDIMTQNSPTEFMQDPTPIPFLKSLFSKTENFSSSSSPNKRTTLKIPFSVSPDELESLRGVDVRVAGNGVIFSGLFLVALVIIVISLRAIKKSHITVFRCTILIAISTLLLILIIKETWWARYIPFLYAIVPASLILISYTNFKLSSAITYALFILAMVNTSLFIIYNLPSTLQEASLSNCKSDLLPHNQNIVYFNLGLDVFYGGIYNITDCHSSKKLKLIQVEKQPTGSKAAHVVKGFIGAFY